MTTQITLPRDAEGREIPLDTKALYNAKGEKLRVNRVEFDPFKQEWEFCLPGDLHCWDIACRPKDVLPSKSRSARQLEKAVK